MAERLHAIVVRDATTMALVRTLPLPCGGINHADFTADLTVLVASCEFTGRLMVVDADVTHLVKVVDLNGIAAPGATSPAMADEMAGPRMSLAGGASAMPQDVRLAPDGRSFVVADMLRNGVWVIDAQTLAYARFIPTGSGAHGVYPSRDASAVYVGNRRGDGQRPRRPHARADRPVGHPRRWLPGHGRALHRRHRALVVGAVQLRGLRLRHPHWTGDSPDPRRCRPQGLLVWPQPGRFSLGHTGNMR